MATCPECDAEIEVDEFDVDKGDQLTCPDCGSNLEVTGLAPIELDLADDDEDGLLGHQRTGHLQIYRLTATRYSRAALRICAPSRYNSKPC